MRDGEHLAKVYGLPAPVVDIIKQHHGTSVLQYFFHKAQEETKDEVYEESYRYEEQKPRSKEAAIIMLADSLEAQVRLMENPTRRKIQGLIQEVIRQKIQDGQLDESDLTQSDLHKIEESFDQSLLALVGHRIRDPEKNGRRAGMPPSGRRAASGEDLGTDGRGEDAGESRKGTAVPPSAVALKVGSAKRPSIPNPWSKCSEK